MKIHESQEDYLEVILKLKMKISNVRAIDIAHELGFSKPSVSIALKNLKEQGLVNVEGNIIDLTNKGLEIAQKTLEKEELITAFFKKIGINEEIAQQDACKIEHVLHDETWDKLKAFISEKI
jgi:Mn-dependent DtxR family transcriptional regulator